MERGKFPAVLGKEIEKIPLRHQRNELAAGRQMGEIRKRVFAVAEERADGRRFLMRQLEKLVEQAELAHDVERRGMDGIAAEVAQEVGVFLEHDDIDAGAREQKTQHEAAWASADDGAPGGELLGGNSLHLARWDRGRSSRMHGVRARSRPFAP